MPQPPQVRGLLKRFTEKTGSFVQARQIRLKAFFASPRGQRWSKISGTLLTAGLMGYILWRLHTIGWQKVAIALPAAPVFYLLVVGRFFVSPAFQTIIFSILWGLMPRRLFPVFLAKQVWDRDVLDYSGQMYLFVWAKQHLRMPVKRILHILKDNTICSSAASAGLGMSLLLLFWSLGFLTISQEWYRASGRYLLWTILCLPLFIILYVKLKKSILYLQPKLLWTTYGLHTLRLLVGQVLLLCQWAVAMPDVSLTKWCMLLAVWIIVTWIPVIPSKDLVFIGAGMEMAEIFDLSEPLTASMLVAAGALNKMLNLIILGGFLLVRRRQEKTMPIGS